PGDGRAGRRETLERGYGDDPRPAIGGDRDGERARRTGKLDAPGDPNHSRRGHELDAVQIVTRAERRRWVAGALLCGGRPCGDGAEEEDSAHGRRGAGHGGRQWFR